MSPPLEPWWGSSTIAMGPRWSGSSASASASPGSSTLSPSSVTTTTRAQSFSSWLSAPPGVPVGTTLRRPSPMASDRRAVQARTGTRAARSSATTWSRAADATTGCGTSASVMGIWPSTSERPAVWSAWPCESTSRSMRRTPWRRRQAASGVGPASISTVGPPGSCSRAAAPSPTLSTVSVGRVGAAGRAGARARASATSTTAATAMRPRRRVGRAYSRSDCPAR